MRSSGRPATLYASRREEQQPQRTARTGCRRRCPQSRRQAGNSPSCYRLAGYFCAHHHRRFLRGIPARSHAESLRPVQSTDQVRHPAGKSPGDGRRLFSHRPLRAHREGWSHRQRLLKKGKDPLKDQSYFLCRLTQEQLALTLFPLGDMTKNEGKKNRAGAGPPRRRPTGKPGNMLYPGR